MATSVPLPPAMADVQSKTPDELFKEFNQIPLFMTHLPQPDASDPDASSTSNVALEGLKALAYEGTRAEVAANFRTQGNECAQAKQWKDGQEFYTKALAALRGPQGEPAEVEGGDVVELDEVEEERKERTLEEVCYVNRALCNLELKNYRSCLLDCAAALKLNPKNIKAYYRAARASLALDKFDDARDASRIGLSIDAANAPLKTLGAEIAKRQKIHDSRASQTKARQEKDSRVKNIMAAAFRSRNVRTRQTGSPPNMEDAVPQLSDPLNPASTLSLPVLFLYPLVEQTDLIKKFEETHSLNDHLAYMLADVEWDRDKEYVVEAVDCYMETSAGGLVKAGKKLPLSKIFETGKVEVVDGMLQVYVVPRTKAAGWIASYKERRAAMISR